MIEDVKEFADKFNQPKLDAPGFLPEEVMKNRLEFQMEELLETASAAGFVFNTEKMEFQAMGHGGTVARESLRNLAEVLDGLVDQVYVALGTAYAMGFFAQITPEAGGFSHPKFKTAWNRVHRANMEKVTIPGMWKIQKPKGWERPDLSDLVE